MMNKHILQDMGRPPCFVWNFSKCVTSSRMYILYIYNTLFVCLFVCLWWSGNEGRCGCGENGEYQHPYIY